MPTSRASATSLPAQSADNGFTPLPRADIRSVADALLTVPHNYIDASKVYEQLGDAARALEAGQPMVVCAFAITGIVGYDENKKAVAPEDIFRFIPKKRRMNAVRLEVLCQDEQGANFSISVFGAISPWKNVRPGRHTLIVKGFKRFGQRLFAEAELADGRMLDVIGSVAPLYRGIPGAVTADRMTATIDHAVNLAMDDPNWWIAARNRVLELAHTSEAELLEVSSTSASNLAVILRALHRPTTFEEACLAKQAVLQVAAAAVRCRSQYFFKSRPANPAASIVGIRQSTANVIAELESETGINLTNNQRQCVAALAAAWEKETPSAHMLNGDVGSGKTLTFLAPAVAAFRRGKNVAIMAPTSILADQLAKQMVTRFPSTAVARLEPGDKIPADRAILIGTPGLITICGKAKWTPDVLVIDEQHKMSAPVRESLVGPATHVVEATATPIPRSMAIAMYAGLTQLVLSELPFKNERITRAVYGPEGRQEMSLICSRALRDGAKVAFVYPAVAATQADADDTQSEQAETARLKASVLDAYARLQAKWPGKVARLYGDMNEAEQRAEIDALRSGQKNVLVASSLIEVGIDIPGLDVMVVNNADRFGLAQLHQLRGRTARTGGTGHFLMYLEKPQSEYDLHTTERMAAMETINDGFRLAEVDLMQRGFGDTAGDQQSGRGNLIFRGIQLTPKEFLKLSVPASTMSGVDTLTLPEPGEPEDEVVCAGQISLL